MKITIDLRMLTASGIGTYIRNLVPSVITALPHVNFCLLGYADEMAKECPWKNAANIEVVDCHSPVFSIKEQIELLYKIPKDTDLYWAPHFNIPIFYSGKILVTVHDVYFLGLPTLVKGILKKTYASIMYNAVAYKANDIMCDSYFTENELMDLVSVNRDKITTIHIAVDKSHFRVCDDKPPYDKSYLLYVGNVKPHKNLATLMKAFEKIMHKIPHNLVIVGKKEGFITGDKHALDYAESLGARIHFTGFVSDDDLQKYFACAEAFVFPSIYEGFGLPPLEAMACGCPVISSHAASLQEVCGDGALYCDAYSPDDIAEKILLLTNNKELRTKLIQKGHENLNRFSWQRTTNEVLQIIHKYIN